MRRSRQIFLQRLLQRPVIRVGTAGLFPQGTRLLALTLLPEHRAVMRSDFGIATAEFIGTFEVLGRRIEIARR